MEPDAEHAQCSSRNGYRIIETALAAAGLAYPRLADRMNHMDDSFHNLRLLALACGKYLSDYGRYPPELKDLVPYAGNSAGILACPVCDKPYLYNKTLVGMTVGTVEDRSKTVLAYDGHADGGGYVVYLDGHVVLMKKENFQKAVNTTK